MSQRMIMVIVAWLSVISIGQADDEIAIAALRQAGATVERDESSDGKPTVKVTYNLRQVTADGINAIKELEVLPAIEFQGTGDTEISVATIRALQAKKSLKQFAINNAKMSDEAAKILGTLTSLEVVELRSQIELSPSGLQHILKLKTLTTLMLADRLVNDTVLLDLLALPNLKHLSIRSVFITDEGLMALKRLKNLQTLRIFIGSMITEVGIRHLAELQLKELELSYSDATNAKLKELRKFSGLTSLRLVNAVGVTDEGVSSLSELTELKQLDLADAKLTKAGIAELKQALPKCEIKYQSRKRD